MQKKQVSQDDLIDVMEMTQKLEKEIMQVLRGNEKALGISALMSATINCMISQCRYLDEVILYRNLFVEIIDASIKDANQE